MQRIERPTTSPTTTESANQHNMNTKTDSNIFIPLR
jgi:hypothetical protein